MSARSFPPKRPRTTPAPAGPRTAPADAAATLLTSKRARRQKRPAAEAPSRNLSRPALAGATAAVLLVGALGGWAATTDLGGAVIARGEIKVTGEAKVVQHPDGGIVEEIAVESGDTVAAGQVLIALDRDIVEADLQIARTRLAAALALRARLEAEQTRAAEITFAYPALPGAIDRAALDIAAQEARQRAIFAARAELAAGARARLAETLAQIEAQMDGLTAQISAADAQIASLDEEIGTKEGLVEDGLSRRSVLNDLVRARADLAGRRAALAAEAAGLGTRAREAEIATEQGEREFREEVVTALREATSEIEELILTIVTKQGQLDRMEIRAPADGVIHELAVTTEGAVVAPGDTLMQIVPQDGRLSFEVAVDPVAIDQVHPGQPAEIVFSAFDQNRTPRLAGEVARISPAAVADPQTGRSFYRVGLDVPATELARLDGLTLVPGMPVEAYLQTGERSVLAYLAQPIAAHMRRAFRE